MKPPTDFAAFVINSLAAMNRQSGSIDQAVLRQCLGLSSSYLLTDGTMNSASGKGSWSAGLNRLVDVLVALHARGELEHETVNEASKACSECWTVAGNWVGMEECRDSVRGVAARLKKLLDENGRTYQGRAVYAP